MKEFAYIHDSKQGSPVKTVPALASFNEEQLDEVLIYAFIYSGASNWQNTQATITIHIPGQPPITTRLTEGGDDRPVGVIARLINVDGTIKVERINQYFDDRESIDQAFGWGLEWHPTKGKR